MILKGGRKKITVEWNQLKFDDFQRQPNPSFFTYAKLLDLFGLSHLPINDIKYTLTLLMTNTKTIPVLCKWIIECVYHVRLDDHFDSVHVFFLIYCLSGVYVSFCGESVFHFVIFAICSIPILRNTRDIVGNLYKGWWDLYHFLYSFTTIIWKKK